MIKIEKTITITSTKGVFTQEEQETFERLKTYFYGGGGFIDQYVDLNIKTYDYYEDEGELIHKFTFSGQT